MRVHLKRAKITTFTCLAVIESSVMSNFAVWVKTQPADEPGIQLLQTFAQKNADKWPYERDEPSAYFKVISDNAATAAEKDEILSSLDAAYRRWLEQTNIKVAEERPGVLERVSSRGGTILLGVFGVIVALVIAYGIFSGNLLESISKPERARGLITFLFAFSTMAMFVLAGIATFWMEKDEVNDRFERAKDLLTLMIGILGTILGFYFGSLSTSDGNRLFLANVLAPSTQVTAGKSTEVSAIAIGGTAPYTYEIHFSDPTGAVPTQELDKTGTSSDGVIKVQFVLPTVEKTGAVSFALSIRDAAGAEARSVGTIFVSP